MISVCRQSHDECLDYRLKVFMISVYSQLAMTNAVSIVSRCLWFQCADKAMTKAASILSKCLWFQYADKAMTMSSVSSLGVYYFSMQTKPWRMPPASSLSVYDFIVQAKPWQMPLVSSLLASCSPSASTTAWGKVCDPQKSHNNIIDHDEDDSSSKSSKLSTSPQKHFISSIALYSCSAYNCMHPFQTFPFILMRT